MNDPSKRGRQCSLRQPGSRRGKQISPVERVSDGPETVLVALDCPHLHFVFLVEDVREQPIIGAEKPISGGIDQERPPGAADARIDNSHMYRSLGEMSITGVQKIGGSFNRVGRYMMTKIDKGGLWVNGENHPLHARHKSIPISEIGQQRDEPQRVRHATIPRNGSPPPRTRLS